MTKSPTQLSIFRTLYLNLQQIQHYDDNQTTWVEIRTMEATCTVRFLMFFVAFAGALIRHSSLWRSLYDFCKYGFVGIFGATLSF